MYAFITQYLILIFLYVVPPEIYANNNIAKHIGSAIKILTKSLGLTYTIKLAVIKFYQDCAVFVIFLYFIIMFSLFLIISLNKLDA